MLKLTEFELTLKLASVFLDWFGVLELVDYDVYWEIANPFAMEMKLGT